MHSQQYSSSLPPISLHAQHALTLYRGCVEAGLWSRLVIEHRQGGERITFSSRPPGVAATINVAAPGGQRKPRKRRDNRQRVERKRRWLENKRASSLAAQSKTAAASVAAVCTQSALVGEPAAAENEPAAVGPTQCGSSTPPLLERAAKKRKAGSPGVQAAIPQSDGALQSPPPSPEEPSRGAAVSNLALNHIENLFPPVSQSPSSVRVGPPTPPPRSKFLSSYHKAVICKYCLSTCHGIGYSSCRNCWEKHGQNYNRPVM